MADVWSSVQHFVTCGGVIPITWIGAIIFGIVATCSLVVLGRLSTHSFGPLSGAMFVIFYVAFLKWVMFPMLSNDSALSTIMFYPKAIVALLVLLFILHFRRAELEAEQRMRNCRSEEAIAAALRQIEGEESDEPTLRNAPKFSLYLRPFVSTNELPVQFDHSDNDGNLPGFERIDLENVIRLSLAPRGLFVAVGGSDDDVIGASRVQTTNNWQTKVADLIRRADLIFVLPSHHDGTLWEIESLVRNRRLAKCIWIMPECVFRKGMQLVVTPLGINWFYSGGDQNALRRAKTEWFRATNAVKAHGVHLPAYKEEGLLFKMNDDGQIVASQPLNLRNTLRRVHKVRQLIRKLQGRIASA